MTCYNIIKKFIKNNYGESEVENPCYNLKALANEIESELKLKEIKSRLETLIQYKIERHPESYYIRTTTGGFGYSGCAKNEDVYDEVKAKEDVIDDCEWVEDDQICELINELLWRI